LPSAAPASSRISRVSVLVTWAPKASTAARAIGRLRSYAARFVWRSRMARTWSPTSGAPSSSVTRATSVPCAGSGWRGTCGRWPGGNDDGSAEGLRRRRAGEAGEAVHVRPQCPRDRDAAVGLLVVLEDGDERATDRQA